MERHELMAMMAELSLAGMRTVYDEVMADGLKRQRTVQQILGDLLAAERAEKKARSIRYQLGAARLPLARTLAEFDFAASPVNEALVRDLHDGGFLETQRNAVFVGGTGSGKTHICIAITANCVRRGARPVLQRHRPGEPAGGRGPGRTGRQARRPVDPRRSGGAGRARLPAVLPEWRPAAVPYAETSTNTLRQEIPLRSNGSG